MPTTWSRLEIWIDNLSGVVFLTGFILYMALRGHRRLAAGRLNLERN